MYAEPWTDAEVEMLKLYYPKHGIAWDGWAEVLPKRTVRAIQRKANSGGLVVEERRKPTRPANVKRPDVFDTHKYKPQPRSADPAELFVMRKMSEGMTPTQIDRERGWWPGRTIQILTERWAREKEKYAGKASRRRGNG